MTLYFKVNINSLTVVGDASPLPDHLVGLADETLRDLTPLSEQVPEYKGLGWWPQELHQCADVSERVLIPDPELGVIVDKVPCPNPPALDYATLRAAAYPPMADYLDAKVKQASDDPLIRDEGVVQEVGYLAACLAVKAAYPKPVPE